MIFTAYFDEADTHGPAPTVILAAYLGHAYQWRRFETRLGRLQDKHGFKVFHAKDFKSRRRAFLGWTNGQCAALIRDLSDLARDTLTLGLTVRLERERYLQEYRAPPIPRKLNLDSQYGVCFRACLGYLLETMGERGNRDRLHVVMERGHPNVWDCERIFSDLKGRLARSGEHVLGDFTVATKGDCSPLMVADMLAATHSMMQERLKGLLPDIEGTKLETSRKRGPLAFLELQPGASRPSRRASRRCGN